MMFKVFRTLEQKADKLIIEGVYLDGYVCINGDDDGEVNLFILKKMKEKGYILLCCTSPYDGEEKFYFKKEIEK